MKKTVITEKLYRKKEKHITEKSYKEKETHLRRKANNTDSIRVLYKIPNHEPEIKIIDNVFRLKKL